MSKIYYTEVSGDEVTMIKKFVLLFSLTLSLGFLFGCQTNMVRQFNQVHEGMDKDEVLELMGSPTTKTRFHGKDRWFYTYYENDVRYDKEIHFLNGKSVYVGGPYEPPVERSAAVADQKNQELDDKLQTDKAKRQVERKNVDAIEEYEKEVRGEGKKVKYMPDFKPVQ